jgi:hypothetical protein
VRRKSHWTGCRSLWFLVFILFGSARLCACAFCAFLCACLSERNWKFLSDFPFPSIGDIEVVGSATRSLLVVGALRDVFGKEPRRTMNSEEAVAKGCALQVCVLDSYTLAQF